MKKKIVFKSRMNAKNSKNYYKSFVTSGPPRFLSVPIYRQHLYIGAESESEFLAYFVLLTHQMVMKFKIFKVFLYMGLEEWISAVQCNTVLKKPLNCESSRSHGISNYVNSVA